MNSPALLPETASKVLRFLEQYIGHHRYSPTHRVIQEACGLSSPSVVAYALKRLEKDGYIAYRKGAGTRSIRLVEKCSNPCPHCILKPVA